MLVGHMHHAFDRAILSVVGVRNSGLFYALKARKQKGEKNVLKLKLWLIEYKKSKLLSFFFNPFFARSTASNIFRIGKKLFYQKKKKNIEHTFGGDDAVCETSTGRGYVATLEGEACDGAAAPRAVTYGEYVTDSVCLLCNRRYSEAPSWKSW